MKNKQTENSLIILAVIILIAGGVYYYKNYKTANLVVELPSGSSTTKSTNIAEEPKPIVNTNPKKNTENTAINTAQNTAKFNLAMDNARQAFRTADYDKAIAFYNEALLYNKTDTPYSGLFITHSAQNNIDKARIALEAAIKINPYFTEYWIEKLTLLDEKTTLSFADLKGIYQEGLAKADPKTKINLVTSFARIAERNGEKSEAIALWQYAIELYPQNTFIYQGEIDRIQSS